MICNQCNTENAEGSKFCIKCGNNLQQQTMYQQQVVNNTVQPTMNMQEPSMINNTQPVNNINGNQMNNSQVVQNITTTSAPLNIIAFMIGAFIKPIRCFKEETSKLNNPKNSIIMGIIVTIASVVFSLLNKVMSLVVVKDYYNDKTTWQWSNLENFEWFKVIGKDLLFFGGIIFGVALLFYLASLIIKKDTNYMKMVAITSIAILPAILGNLVLGPLLGQLWDKFAIAIPMLGNIYMLILMYELVNEEVKLEGDAKIYFNLICFGILIIALYFINLKYTISTISSGYDDLLSEYSDLFS